MICSRYGGEGLGLIGGVVERFAVPKGNHTIARAMDNEQRGVNARYACAVIVFIEQEQAYSRHHAIGTGERTH